MGALTLQFGNAAIWKGSQSRLADQCFKAGCIAILRGESAHAQPAPCGHILHTSCVARLALWEPGAISLYSHFSYCEKLLSEVRGSRESCVA